MLFFVPLTPSLLLAARASNSVGERYSFKLKTFKYFVITIYEWFSLSAWAYLLCVFPGTCSLGKCARDKLFLNFV
jgi:hypothetical protein